MKKLVQLLFKKQANRDDLSLYEEIFSQDVLIHGPASGQKTQGLATALKYEKIYIRTYPGRKFTLEEMFSYGNRVFVRWICRVDSKEKYKKTPIKNFPLIINGLSIYRIVEGKIVEVWQYWDRLGILEQIGEVRTQRDPIEPGYYLKLLKSVGMESYVENISLLTKRERECFKLLLEGKTAKDTAILYNISHRTVEAHFEKIKKKLNCSTKRDLFTAALILDKLELL